MFSNRFCYFLEKSPLHRSPLIGDNCPLRNARPMSDAQCLVKTKKISRIPSIAEKQQHSTRRHFEVFVFLTSCSLSSQVRARRIDHITRPREIHFPRRRRSAAPRKEKEGGRPAGRQRRRSPIADGRTDGWTEKRRKGETTKRASTGEKVDFSQLADIKSKSDSELGCIAALT